MKPTTLNLEASKAIHELGVEVESEKWWSDELIMQGIAKEWVIVTSKAYDKAQYIPAPNLQELFLALPEIGEKLGWDEREELRDPMFNEIRNYKYYSLILTDTYLESGMEGVSKQVIELLSSN